MRTSLYPSHSHVQQSSTIVRRATRAVFIACATIACVCAPSAIAQTGRPQMSIDPLDTMRDIPDNVIAWWVFDPNALGSKGESAVDRRIIEGALRIALSSGMVEGDTAEILTGLLAGSAFSDAPSRVCLLDIQTAPDTSLDATLGDWKVTSVNAIIEIHTHSRQPALLQTVQSVFVDSNVLGDGTSGQPTQKQLTLSTGQAAVLLTFPPDIPQKTGQILSPWSEISWTSEPGVFTLAIGAGTLERWMGMRTAPRSNTLEALPWQPHRAAVNAHTGTIGDMGASPSSGSSSAHAPRGRTFAEIYINMDALRDRFEQSMLFGRTNDVLNVSRIGNMRDVMLHARLVNARDVRVEGGLPNATYDGPPLIELDASCSSRQHAPGTAHATRVADSVWPTWLIRSGPPPGSYAMVLNINWERTIAWTLATKRAMLDRNERPAFNSALRVWTTRYSATLRRLTKSFESQIVLTDVPKTPIAIPGVTTLLCEAKTGMNYQRLLRDLDSVFGSIHTSVRPIPDKLMWSVSILPEDTDPAGIFGVFAVGLAGTEDKPVLVAGWSSLSVTHNQDRLGKPARRP